MSEEALIGIWSSDRRYGPGAMADESLVFLADHRGFWKYANPGASYVEAFRWAIHEDGMLTISGTTSYDVEHAEEGERVTEAPGLLHFEGLRFRIERENTPRGERMDVLTLDEGQDRWRMSLFETFGLLADKFGLVRRDLDNYTPPQFLGR